VQNENEADCKGTALECWWEEAFSR